jgi:polyisoprenyl-phosphate glycosyltransferase
MISVVIPCYNEDQALNRLFERLTAAAEKWNEPFEIVVVDDGSSKRTWDLICNIHERDSRWKAVRLSRNFGHQIAISAGMYHSRGDCTVIIDGDLQDPPEEIERLISKWREGYEVVYAIRTKRKESLIRRLCYSTFYRLLDVVTTTPMPLDAGDFCLLDRKVLDLLNNMQEGNRYVRGLRSWVGFRQTGLAYERDSRWAGKPKYTFRKLVKLALNGIFSFSYAPLRFITYSGIMVVVLSFLGGIFTLSQRFFLSYFRSIGLEPVTWFATIFIGMLFIGGVQLISLGIIGEYIARIYDEVRRRPLWVEQQSLGIE